MKIVLCCGGREWDNFKKVYKVLKHEHAKEPIDFLIEGGQKSEHEGSWGESSWKGFYGGDYQARQAAMKLGIQVVECPANWDFHGRKAGPIRNAKQLAVAANMAHDRSDKLIVLAFHSDLESSKGTKHMVNLAKSHGYKVKVIK